MLTLWIVSGLLVIAALDFNAILGAIIAGVFLLANTVLTLKVTGRRDRHDRDMIREEVELADKDRKRHPKTPPDSERPSRRSP